LADKELRELEAAWLREQMKAAGISNTELHARLERRGWSGQINNIAQWRNGTVQIPDRVVPLLAEILSPDSERGDWHDQVVAIFVRRQPYLRPYLRSPGSSSTKPAMGIALPAAPKPTSKKRPVYIPTGGELKGVRHVPFKDADGHYIAGYSRYKEDKKAFRTIVELVEALARDPKLHVRVIAEGVPGAKPSLVRQQSLLWE
jgi:hypothetical protein